MSVQAHLNGLASSLNIADNESASITTSVNTLHYRLGSWFPSDNMKERFRFGSSTRRTMLPRAADSRSDVDYMIVFDNSDGAKPQTLISRLKRFAEAKYSTSQIYQSSPTVVLELNHIKFDLVPGYRSWGTLYIPAPYSSYQNWISTDPHSFNSQIDSANSQAGYRVKPVVRLIKYWNARNGYVWDSYQLEKMIVGFSFLFCSNIRDCMYSAFETMHSNRWNLPTYKREKVERAKSIIDNTKYYEREGMPITAEQEIKKLLPSL